jgi:peptidoglycan/LPS O-acetylase OafA/YrhL
MITGRPSPIGQEAGPGHLAYRPDIDGLRAVAILSVLGFHAFPAWVPGGFIGVDIFFVISGYLISGILLSNLRAGRFSLLNFYARRIRRIFPALVFVLLAVAVAGFFILWPGEYSYLGKHIAGSAGFIVNILLWGETGYFDGHTETKPLLHLWSLGVEEQFYIFWPLMLWAVWRWKHRAGALIALAGLASFAANIWLINHNAIIDFYSPLSRFWELMAGGALAWAGHNGILRRPSHVLATVLSVLGVLLIVAGDFGFDKDMPFPGWLALLPTGGACFLIASNEESFINRRLLGNRVMIGVGLISYPLYLWHWPLLSYAQILSGESPIRNVRIAMIVMAFLLASLTYKFIETPLRKGPLKKRNVMLLFGIMVGIGVLGAALVLAKGLPQRFLNGTVTAEALDGDRLIEVWQHNVRMHSCHLQEAESDQQAPQCIERERPLLLLWGDSHAASLYPGLKRLQTEYKFGIAQLTQAGCPPILDVPHLTFRKNCNAINQRILTEAAELKPSVILLSAAWRHHDYPMEDADMLARLITLVAEIKKGVPDAKIIVVGPELRWYSPLPSIYRRSLTIEGHTPPQRMRDHLDPAMMQLNSMMAAKMAANGIDYLSPQAQLCDGEGCLTRLGDGLDSLTFIDEEHVTVVASVFLIHQFAPQILGGLHLEQKP